MAFFEERFPERISLGAVGGPAWNTSVARVGNGRRVANRNMEYPLHKYDASQAVKTEADFEEVRAFFYVVAGRFDAFRFKDWTDYEVAAGQGVIVTLPSGARQLARRYTFGARNFDRLICKPVPGTVAITGGGTLDYTTGLIAGGTPTAWTGEFDVPCAFSEDLMRTQIVNKRPDGQLLLGWDSIGIDEEPQ